MKNKTTHFGFDEIPLDEKGHRVNQVFNSVSYRYDIMNDVMSFGIHRIWKIIAIYLSSIKAGDRVIDIAAGTCDISKKLSRLVGKSGIVIATDINASMLTCGRNRMIDSGDGENIHYVQSNAESLPFNENTFDTATIAFGLRNTTYLENALSSINTILKPGGKLVILEFSKPTSLILRKLYDFYSFNFIPKFGKIIVNDENSYRYLIESIRKHPDQPSLLQLMKRSGFDRCEYFNLTGGIVAVHTGYKY